MSNYAESKKKFDEIRNRVGEPMFRMGISHLMDVGIRNLDKDLVEETCEKIMQEDDSKAFMTNGFKCELIRTAYELAQISHVDLLAYISREMFYDVGDDMPTYDRAIKLLKGCLNWLDDDLIEREETLDTLTTYIGFDEDEIEALGFGYLFDAREEE
jgi:hypothetical protein